MWSIYEEGEISFFCHVTYKMDENLEEKELLSMTSISTLLYLIRSHEIVGWHIIVML